MANLLIAQRRTAANAYGGGFTPVGQEWTNQQISDVLSSPIDNVNTNWPLIQNAMANNGTAQRLHKVGVLATIGVEDRAFEPINEYGSDAYFFYMYDINSPDANRRVVARQLGNLTPGDGIKFHGRGELQLTGHDNYLYGGQAIGVDLVNNPEAANDPWNAAQLFVWFFNQKGIWDQCLAQNWLSVRYLVNGGYTGIRDFMSYVMSFTYLNAVEGWRVLALSDGASHWGDPYTWDGEQPGGFDCSGFAKYEYGLSGRPLTSYTDAAFDETIPVSEDSATPGDLVFYEYHDASQPGVTYPHMGLWLDQSRTLDSRGGVGVGIHSHVANVTRHVHRYP